MESASAPAAQPAVTDATAPGAKGLKPNAIGYASNLVIAVASTAPAYSLAATLGFIVAVITYGTGRTNLLSGIVHLVLLAFRRRAQYRRALRQTPFRRSLVFAQSPPAAKRWSGTFPTDAV